jgi:hypothetical protein
MTIINLLYKIWGAHSNEYKNYSVVGYDTMYSSGPSSRNQEGVRVMVGSILCDCEAIAHLRFHHLG